MQAGAASVADRASKVIMRYARLGGAIAGGVALLGLLITGAALLVGRAALDGTAETIWTVVGIILLIAAVVPPVIAAFSLRSVGKFGSSTGRPSCAACSSPAARPRRS